VLDADALHQDVGGVDDVVLAEHHAFGRPGGARRVDQRRQVVGLHGAAKRVEICCT
jgi:hypothetical protein